MTPENELEAREYLRQLKDYYTGLATKGAIILLCIVIWLFTGGGFWPIWVILAFGIHAFIGGVQLGVFPMVQDLFPFLRSDWEETQLKKILDQKQPQKTKPKDKESQE